MALNHSTFRLLATIERRGRLESQRALSKESGLSLGTVNSTLRSLEAEGLVDAAGVTATGLRALRPYRVHNAIIMAAGASTRLAAITYEKPKGLIKVRGEVLVERQIRQLKEAGINDITLVVGYRREYYLYLAAKFGIDIVVNDGYATRNNNGTLWMVRDRLTNTYVCCCDHYFAENPFERYVYGAYYSAQFVEGPTRRWCLTTGAGDRITGVTIGGHDSWVMAGHAYFDKSFSTTFVKVLEEVYSRPETMGKLWEDIYVEHIDELKMAMRRYPDGLIREFNSLDDLRTFDPTFIENVDGDIFDNIADALACEKSQIHDFYPLKQGITNLSCHFAVGEGADRHEYVYRHPGVGGDWLIDRPAEVQALCVARDLGLNETFVFEDPERGWMISHFVPGATCLDAHDPEQARHAMELARSLHQSGATLEREFDFIKQSLFYEKSLIMRGPIDVPGYHELREKVLRLKGLADADGLPKCISHNDFIGQNFLIGPDGSESLIDWEYAGMSDEANDFATFVVCSELSDDEAEHALRCYFGREPSLVEYRNFWSHVVFTGWCWYVWCLVKESCGEDVGRLVFLYYRYASLYVDKILAMYEKEWQVPPQASVA